MPTEQPNLESLQRWMQTVIMHPGGVVHGVASDAARQQIQLNGSPVETIISRSQALSGAERLEVYSRAYFARLLECLRAEYPITIRASGEELFDEFAVGYLQQHPSQSYTLGQLGSAFASYLRNTAADKDSAHAASFLVDLVKLERIFSEVFDGPGVEGQALLNPAQLLGIAPSRMHQIRLVVVKCLRLVAIDYPVHRYYSALKHQETALPPEALPKFLAVTRKDYIVRHYELSPVQFALLSAIASGATLGEAVAKAADAAGEGPEAEQLAGSLQEWFRRWSSEGLFLAVELPETAD